ncbi:VOC family protein [bacterium]|nr:VOC family protein [bacterium]
MAAAHGTLHHIELYVSSLKKSRQFYQWLLEDKLRYTLFQEWENGISFRLGDTYIVLVQTESDYLAGPFHRKQTGLNHLAFHVESREVVDSLTEECQQRLIPILYADRHPFAGGPDHYALYIEDPDRIKLELVAPE